MALANVELLARFEIEHFDRNSISPDRRKKTLWVLDRVAEQIAPRSLVEASPSDLMAWQGAELGRGLKPNTVRNRETMIRAFVTWATAAGLVSFETSVGLKSVTSVRGSRVIVPKPYKKAEIELLRESLHARYPLAPVSGPGSKMVRRYMRGEGRLTGAAYRHARRLQLEAQISLALEEGLRCHELWRLDLARMSPDNVGVVVFTAKQGPGEVREREVPYTSHSRGVVQEWLDFRSLMAPGHSSPWLALFASKPTEAQKEDTFNRSLQPLGRPFFNWHRLRHTFATERLRAGLPLEQLQVMMGHANLAQTLAYAKIVNADLQKEAERTEDQFSRNLGLAA